MPLDDYHSVTPAGIVISAEQGSRFAKDVADDFNPIHDVDAKRFCVPGDLLFALVLCHYGLSRQMTFDFRGMVGADIPLSFPEGDPAVLEIADAGGKLLLHVERDGEICRDLTVLEDFVRHYVAFSGHNFPHVLQPLLREQGVMFNPERPLVMYDSMSFELNEPPTTGLAMTMTDSRMEVSGKRGDVLLDFSITANGRAIGAGTKKLVVSGLRAYDDAQMQALITEFNASKADYYAASPEQQTGLAARAR